MATAAQALGSWNGAAINPLQAAMYAKLTGDSQLAALVGDRIYDHIPENERFPYVRIGEFTTVEWGSRTRRGEEITATVHIWSDGAGNKEAATILGHVMRLLGRVKLSVTGYDVLRSFFDGTQVLPDDVERHIVPRFRFLLQEAYV